MKDHEKIEELVRLKDQAPLTFDPLKSALLIVDVQRWFARPDYTFTQTIEKLVPGATEAYFERVASRVLPNIQRLQNRFPEWMREFDHLAKNLVGNRACPAVNDPSWQIDDSAAPLPHEMVLNKSSSGPLNSTKLDQILHNWESIRSWSVA